MADTIAEMQIGAEAVLAKKARNKKTLKLKTITANEANILAGKFSQASLSPLPSMGDTGKENQGSLSNKLCSPKKTKAPRSKKSFDKELQEMQEKLEQLHLEKEKTEELLQARDQMLKQREEELETRGQEQEKLQLQLKKLQKLKEFNPTMTFSVVQSLREKEQEKNEINKKKKKKDCPEKKRPSPVYALWCKDQWNEVKKEHPDAEFKEISNILGARWKNLNAEEKKPCEEKYQAEKEAYLLIVDKEKRENEAMKLLEDEQKQKTAMELLEQYLQFKQEAEKENKKTKKEKDPLKPKQPLSAFFLFSKDRRAALLAENNNILEVAKITGDEWKNMTEEQRGPYEKIARKQKEEYMREMELYKHKKDEEVATLQREQEEQMKIHKQEALQMLKKKEKTENIIRKTKENRQKKKKEVQNTDPKKPKKPASSFLLFSKETRKVFLQERPGINNSTLNAMISVKWKELGEAEKQIWNDKAAEAMKAYKKELEEYNKSVATTDLNAQKF